MTFAEGAHKLQISLNSFRALVEKNVLEKVRVGVRSTRAKRRQVEQIAEHGLTDQQVRMLCGGEIASPARRMLSSEVEVGGARD